MLNRQHVFCFDVEGRNQFAEKVQMAQTTNRALRRPIKAQIPNSTSGTEENDYSKPSPHGSVCSGIETAQFSAHETNAYGTLTAHPHGVN